MAARAMEDFGNIVLLDRPVRVNSLISAARTAIRSRHRQYILRRQMAVLAEQTEQLQISNRELEQFAYVSSHDLQEPLRKISTFGQMLEARFDCQLDDEGKRFLHIITGGAARMSSLIHDLLNYARLTTQEPPLQPTALIVPLSQVLRDLEQSIQDKGAVVTIEPLPTVKAGAARLYYVFLNLINNALKFQSERPLEISISAIELNGQARISVRDNGIGIDQRYSSQVFQVFQRLHNRSKYEGNGIGLAICKKIIEQYRGRIWFESEPGEGTNFLFTLPLAEAARSNVVVNLPPVKIMG
jgi:chemotaxis family two-component system sensor kinase Cph1